MLKVLWEIPQFIAGRHHWTMVRLHNPQLNTIKCQKFSTPRRWKCQGLDMFSTFNFVRKLFRDESSKTSVCWCTHRIYLLFCFFFTANSEQPENKPNKPTWKTPNLKSIYIYKETEDQSKVEHTYLQGHSVAMIICDWRSWLILYLVRLCFAKKLGSWQLILGQNSIVSYPILYLIIILSNKLNATTFY